MGNDVDRQLCTWCSQPLIGIKSRHYICFVCDNVLCPGKFRHTEYYIERVYSREDKKVQIKSTRVSDPKYQAGLIRGQENYHLATSLGIGSVEASRLRCKSKEEIEKRAKELAKI
jgi:hypothetical protein